MYRKDCVTVRKGQKEMKRERGKTWVTANKIEMEGKKEVNMKEEKKKK